ncbi:MAG: hypothetical protein EP349_10515 [Alphaproteobacteria bacterium]|nr:MAG: hypothetical protein EP349_10515 [Alphaproteobacteria bacterium]
MFAKLRSKKNAADPAPVQLLYNEIVNAARRPEFYSDWQVPDTVEGRFEMLVLHIFFVLRRLQEEKTSDGIENPQAENFSQQLFDHMFLDMDRSLREQGVGDLGVPKRIRKMAKAFYGRVFAYENGLKDGTLTDALQRNVYDGADVAEKSPAALARYAEKQYKHVMAQSAQDVMQGKITWL